MSSKLTTRRAGASRTSMFLRMLLRAAVLRRGRAAAALLAMVVAAGAATAILNLYVDTQAKLREQFRNYGANVVVVTREREVLPPDALDRVNSAIPAASLAVPFGYAVARTSEGRSLVVSGTDFDKLRKLNRWWEVTNWPQGSELRSVFPPAAASATPIPALVGVRAAPVVTPQGKPFDLSFRGRTIHLTPAATVRTGAAEDDRVYISLKDFERWTGLQASTIEVAVSGSIDQIKATIQNLQPVLPGVEVRPVRQIVEGEARVLGKMRSTLLASAILIILTAALCLLATLIGWVSDRRRDFAILKALGASAGLINSFFAAEAAVLGTAGSALGFGIGTGIAVWIGRVNFHASVAPRLGLFPVILAGSILVALLSAIVPISLLQRLQPANILRGE
jgi:putative ABC transport system permease protein